MPINRRDFLTQGSRILGGYHISADKLEGLRMVRKVAHVVWAKAQAQFEGKC
jgi:hypothetical protein